MLKHFNDFLILSEKNHRNPVPNVVCPSASSLTTSHLSPSLHIDTLTQYCFHQPEPSLTVKASTCTAAFAHLSCLLTPTHPSTFSFNAITSRKLSRQLSATYDVGVVLISTHMHPFHITSYVIMVIYLFFQ